ncbi:PAS domain S-box protein [Microcoleus sp. FACHB-831]|uniref:PAS domain S-box protein n=1 Tax=Microcoleus sp. FACHB-831 TaxID=2692827 RepID=UPI001682386A|nr:PAS domain S-box protein [Microcoleus sp. FACHB-831]MBD1921948.1 PAS domain S-box protein [Microcoleus sp. FACHB-831]
MNQKEVFKLLESQHDRLTLLKRSAGELPQTQPQSELMTQVLDAFEITLEEQHIVVEELAANRQQLEAERQRYQDLFAFAPDGYLVTDENGNIQEANLAAGNLLNVAPNFLLHKPLAAFIVMEDRQVFRTKLSQLQQLDGVQEWEVRLQPRGGEPFDASLRVSHIRNQTSKPRKLRYLVRDITYRKQTEAALQAANQDLETKVAERTAFLRQANEELVTEIVERRQTEKALRKSEERYRTLVETIPHGIQEIDTNCTITFGNSAYHRMLGYSEEELLGKPLLDSIATSDRSNFLDYITLILREQPAPTSYFGKNLTKDGNLIDVQVDWNYKRDAGGQVIGFSSVITDITERKRAEENILKQQRLIDQIAETTPAILYIYDLSEQRNIYSNQQLIKILGYSPEEAIAMGDDLLPTILHPEDSAKSGENISRFASSKEGEILELEYRMRHANGEWRWLFSREVVFARNAQGLPQQIVGAAIDITERKQAEEKIWFQSRLLEAIEQALIATDLEGKIIYWNRYAEVMFGWSASEVLGCAIVNVNPAEATREQAVEIMSCLQRGESWSGEFLVRRRDGTTFPIIAIDSPIYNERGELWGIIGVSVDISDAYGELRLRKAAEAEILALNASLEQRVQERTEELATINIQLTNEIIHRKHIEDILIDSEAKLNAILNSAIAVISCFRVFPNRDWQYEYYSFGSEAIYGYTAAELMADKSLWVSRVLPEDWQNIIQPAFEDIFACCAIEYEYRFRHKDDSIRWISGTLLSRWDEVANCWICTCVDIDISDRKAAEVALRESEERFASAFRASPIALTITASPGGYFLDVNEAFLNLLGYSREEVIGHTSLEVGEWFSLDDRRSIIEMLEQQQSVRDLQIQFRIKSGAIRDGVASFVIIELSGQACVLGMIYDISDRKQAEIERDRFFNLSLDMLAIGTFDGYFTHLNPAWQTTLGYTLEELKALPLIDFVHPLDREATRAEMGKLASGITLTYFEYRHRCKDGSYKWLAWTAVPYLEERLIYAVARDTSERKLAEEMLCQRQQEFEAIVENSPDIISRIDRNLRYVFINRAIEQATGISPQEFIGKTHQALGMQAETIASWNQILQSIFETGQNGLAEFKLPSANGSRYYQSRLVPEFAQNGSVASILGITRDITEQKQAEEKIKASLREKDALLQEIHHRVKNNLQIISSLLYLQSRRTEDIKVRQILQDSQNRIGSMALVHENLYGSQDFSKINFVQYIQTLAANLLASYKVHHNAIALRVNVNGDVSVSLDKAIPCGLILNELITNALKHGFSDGKKGEIIISLDANLDGKFTLTVANDGNSLPADFDIHKTQSMGLKLVMTLVKQLKGTLEIVQSNGCAFKIVFVAGLQSN